MVNSTHIYSREVKVLRTEGQVQVAADTLSRYKDRPHTRTVEASQPRTLQWKYFVTLCVKKKLHGVK
jgi:hypothetical protein